jgi:hypothetical protein
MLTTDSNKVAVTTDRVSPATGSAKIASYVVSVSDYQADTGIESLLMLGLSHKDIQSANNRTNWIYRQNPSGRAIVCTVQHTASQEKIGLIAVCRRQIWTPNGLVNAGIFCDLVTDKAHRTLGPAILLMQEALAAAKQLGLGRVYGWPNEKSIVLFKRFPTAELGQVKIFRRYFNWSTMFAEKMPRIPAFLLGGVVKSLDVFFCTLSQLVLNRFFSIKHHDDFGDEFDELWTKSRERYDEIGVRDSRFLNWRFGKNSDCNHTVFTLYSRKDGKPAAYIVYRELTAESVEISDFLALDGQFTERALFRAFCNYIRKSGTLKISLPFAGNQKTRRNLLVSGFISVGSRAAINFPITPASSQKSDISTHITQADHDVG